MVTHKDTRCAVVYKGCKMSSPLFQTVIHKLHPFVVSYILWDIYTVVFSQHQRCTENQVAHIYSRHMPLQNQQTFNYIGDSDTNAVKRIHCFYRYLCNAHYAIGVHQSCSTRFVCIIIYTCIAQVQPIFSDLC